MTAATEPLWAVGSFRVGDEVVTYPVSKADHGRDIATTAKALGSLGVNRATRVLVVSMLSESAQYWPVQIGLLMSQAQFSLADASRFDAFRTDMFLRAMHYDVVLGLSSDVLDGLDDLGHDYSAVFGSVPVLAARFGAYERLQDAGLEPRWWLHVGPTIAVECDARAGAHIDSDEWEIDVDGDEVLITARNPRATAIDHLRTGVCGEVLTDACGCGRDDPRIRP